MSPSPDPYEVLGVWHGASEKEIRQAYWNLAKEYHPDRNKDPRAAERFKEITAAYAELGRPTGEPDGWAPDDWAPDDWAQDGWAQDGWARDGWARDSWVPGRTEDPPPPLPWLTRGKVLFGVAAIAILVVLLIVILNLGSHPAPPPAAAATPSAQPSAEAAAEAAQVNVLLNASAETRSPLSTALEDVRACHQIGTAIVTISAVEQRYAKLYEMAMHLNTGQLPNGAALKNDLVQAYYHSTYSNYHFLNWAGQRESSHCTVQRGSEYNAGTKDAAQAAQFKDAFVGLWNPVARSYGLPVRSAEGI